MSQDQTIKTWCRLHANIRHNPKLWNLNHRQRWIYICFLTFETEGALENRPNDQWFVRETGINLSKFKSDRAVLVRNQLLSSDYRVINFDARQYSNQFNAQRQQRFRDRQKEKTATGNATGNATRNKGNSNASGQVRSDKREPERENRACPEAEQEPEFDTSQVPLAYLSKAQP